MEEELFDEERSAGVLQRNLVPKTAVEEYEASAVFLQTEEHIDNECDVYGVTFLGRQHNEYGERCQDFHLFEDLGDGWHVYLVSDGAGSAKASHRGARINCEVTAHLLGKLIERLKWQQSSELPSEVEWHVQFLAVCRKLREFTLEKIEGLDEPIEPRDFNATLLVLIVTPMGMLTGHIGDGRMGYQTQNGVWNSLITPHKGNEPNETVFLMNSWDKIRIPVLKMSGALVPETSVIRECPRCVAILSDGCENFSWKCVQLNEETSKYEDINEPFLGFWNPLLQTLNETASNERLETYIKFADTKTHACQIEEDDRTMLIGIYSLVQHEEAEFEDTDQG